MAKQAKTYSDFVLYTGYEDIPVEALASGDRRKSLPPMHGALLKNEQDVHLFERLIFLNQRNSR